MNREAKEYALQRLNEALQADPDLMDAIFHDDSRVACSAELVNHPTIICRPGPEGSTLGAMGLLNGLLCQPGDTLRLARDVDSETGELLGFRLVEIEP